MQVMLRQEVPKLGKPGDIVEVAEGYARNYLLPKRIALKVTASTLKEADRLKQKRLAQEREELQQLSRIGERLSGFLCMIEARANEEGQMFGAIHEREIISTLEESGFAGLRTSNILLDKPFRELGDHEIEIQLHPEVRVHITVRIQRMQDVENDEDA